MLSVEQTIAMLPAITIRQQSKNAPVVPSQKILQLVAPGAGQASAWKKFFENRPEVDVIRHSRLMKIYLCKHEVSRQYKAFRRMTAAFGNSKPWRSPVCPQDCANRINDPI